MEILHVQLQHEPSGYIESSGKALSTCRVTKHRISHARLAVLGFMTRPVQSLSRMVNGRSDGKLFSGYTITLMEGPSNGNTRSSDGIRRQSNDSDREKTFQSLNDFRRDSQRLRNAAHSLCITAIEKRSLVMRLLRKCGIANSVGLWAIGQTILRGNLQPSLNRHKVDCASVRLLRNHRWTEVT